MKIFFGIIFLIFFLMSLSSLFAKDVMKEYVVKNSK